MFMRAMYKLPSFGYTYFEGFAFEKPVLIAIGATGLRLLDAMDAARPVLADCSFDDMESFTAPGEVSLMCQTLGGPDGGDLYRSSRVGGHSSAVCRRRHT